MPPQILGGEAAETSRLPRLGLLAFLVLNLISLWQFVLAYCFPAASEEPLSLPSAFSLSFALWYSWGLVGLIAFWLTRRLPLEKHHWPSQLAVHLAFSLGLASFKILIDYPIYKFLSNSSVFPFTFPAYLRMGFGSLSLRYVLYYWAMIAVSLALNYYAKYREGQLRAAQLEAGLSRARLHLLKAQLQPHFLFNTLNAITALVHVDVEAADRMLVRLGDLLRLALEDFAVQEAPLARELEIARSYLEIEQARLGPRLSVQWDIAADTCDALVPTFLLQPLIENAIHHGIAPRIGPGRVEIRARRENSELRLEVLDDGLGLPEAVKPGGGVGLANTRTRLLHLYGEAQRLEIGNVLQGGCAVKITLPFREPASEPSDAIKEQHDSHVNC